jgi:phenylalanyl-tRNA synthetase beta chain
MKISYNWLKDYLDFDLSPVRVGELLTDTGLEVEGIEEFDQVKGGLKGLVIGEVVSCEQHTNADRLKVTEINIGTDTNLPIVCGAPNVAAGQKVIIATVGAMLYPSESEAFEIKKSKIRGEVSEGMICAEDEIGLGKGHAGIMVLKDDAQVGVPAAEYFDLSSDYTIEIGLTPNRADGMSHYGVARDLAAALQHKNIPCGKLTLPELTSFKEGDTKLNIEVKDNEACPRYVGVKISNLKIADSPGWLQIRLKAIGLSPINNVVDVTNYVMHELGQPLHAFDTAKIKGDKVLVQELSNGTVFETLDGVERELSDKDLMICDESEGMCIAGVFGGSKSGVTEITTEIFLESAYFNPVSVRKTAKRHALNTDASFRFERGIDIDITVIAAKRAALLIQELAGGAVSSELLDLYPSKIEGTKIQLDYKYCDSLIGAKIERDTIQSILESLEISVLNRNEDGLELNVPAYRNDVLRPADIVEEILRIYGYNEIPFPERMGISISPTPTVNVEVLRRKLCDHLTSTGYSEMIHNSLTSKELYGEDSDVIKILNPLSNDLSVLRANMLFQGLETIAYNQNRGQSDLKVFEFGKTYHQYSDKREEKEWLVAYLTGKQTIGSWTGKATDAEFFELKGIAENLLLKIGVSPMAFKSKPTKKEALSYGLDLFSGKLNLGSLGMVNKKNCSDFGVKQSVFYLELSWENIVKVLSTKKIKYKTVPKFPGTRRDLALVVDQKVDFQDIRNVALQTERNLLKEVSIFDVYQGKGLEPGTKSCALGFEFLDPNQTLTDKVVDKSIKKIYEQLQKQVGAQLRAGEL